MRNISYCLKIVSAEEESLDERVTELDKELSEEPPKSGHTTHRRRSRNLFVRQASVFYETLFFKKKEDLVNDFLFFFFFFNLTSYSLHSGDV